jgi:hypothetical protein
MYFFAKYSILFVQNSKCASSVKVSLPHFGMHNNNNNYYVA